MRPILLLIAVLAGGCHFAVDGLPVDPSPQPPAPPAASEDLLSPSPSPSPSMDLGSSPDLAETQMPQAADCRTTGCHWWEQCQKADQGPQFSCVPIGD